MIRRLLAVLLIGSPAFAQGKRVDHCAPIGRTADGRLVYSMKCENLPVPPSPPVAAEPGPAPTIAVEPEPDPGGLFKFPFPGLVRPSTERPAGVGSAQPR